MVVLAEGKSVFINTEIDNNFKITPAQLEAAITPKTKLFMFFAKQPHRNSLQQR
jgi:aspartate aminotransferase